MKQKKVLMIGQGAFATAISNLIANNNHSVVILCQEDEVACEINEKKTNRRYAPHCTELHNIIGITTKELANHSYDLIFQAIPISFLEKVLNECKSLLTDGTKPWISLSKGISSDGLTGSQLINQIIHPDNIYVLSGPSFAACINKQDYTGTILAGPKHSSQSIILEVIVNNFFKVYLSDDKRGLELAGAAKNILAIFFGLLESLQFHDNARALFFTKSLEQLNRAIVALGGKSETIIGLGGAGDLFLTCCGDISKNKKTGKSLGERLYLEKDFFFNKEYECEGIQTTKTFQQLLDKHEIELSIFKSLNAILYQEAPIRETVDKLLQSF